jgi:hypothetical protein
MLFDATVPAASPELFVCLRTYLFFPRLAAIVLVQQRSRSCDFKEHHLAWVSPLKVDGGAHGRVVEKIAQAAVLVGHT